MTLAPRVEVYTQLSCRDVYAHRPTLSNTTHIEGQTPILPAYVALETLDEQTYHPTSFNTPTLTSSIDSHKRDNEETVSPVRLSSAQCISDPEVQSATARLQMWMTTIMGLLSALSTAWWGHFSERHGRTRVLAFSTFSMFLT